ncbi:hypothetical protein HYPSUDRAFT_207938 [Hypholoma sublateritium FD-334 SS-4]|uniref:Uncharacterized protein n=1 Tax=Hypholoma sublateritium (strain FD-334 SS-4) TaxID=945553 RepID=A0A0D2LWZ3_HYPSF|nr:hypothetical protein HYPSUDRAFT_207938 [Hypholoma sublateritium FD-334 SS-4]
MREHGTFVNGADRLETILTDSNLYEQPIKKALAALEDFFAKRREIHERRIANEDPVERQRRLARETSAQSRATFARKSTVFEWVDAGNGVYERVQLQSKQADFYWSNYTKNQRHYTSYNNQWDLCPQLPKYSDEFPDDNDPNDVDYDDGYSDDDSFVPMNPKASSALAIPQDGHITSTLLDVQSTLEDSRMSVDDEETPLPSVAEHITLDTFLRDRFGYSLALPFKWPVQAGNQREDMDQCTPSTSLNKAQAAGHGDKPAHSEYTLQMSTPIRHDERRRYEAPPASQTSSSSRRDDSQRPGAAPPPHTSSSSRRNASKKSKGSAATLRPSASSLSDKGSANVQDTGGAILSLSKALMSLSLQAVELDGTFIDLPASFDHSPASPSPLSLMSDALEIRIIATCTPAVYLLRNLGGSLLTDPWMIATKDASTVLLIFRRKWSTIDIIARELTRRGCRFNTVKAVTTPPPPSLPQSAPLGIRLKGYKSTREDYEEYLRRRQHLLCGPKGRAALMHGGIIARIARDTTDPGAVLDGPLYGDTVICQCDDLYLVDDQLTQADKNIICGVYLTQTEQSPEGEELIDGAIRQLSWWPQDSLWTVMGCYLQTEWTDLAEAYYEKRCNILQETQLTIFGVTEWRQTLRKANAWTKKIEAGTERYQREYLTHCYHEILLQANRKRINS